MCSSRQSGRGRCFSAMFWVPIRGMEAQLQQKTGDYQQGLRTAVKSGPPDVTANRGDCALDARPGHTRNTANKSRSHASGRGEFMFT
jgi:hypothetical protein